MVKLQVALSMAEAEALARWATAELRDPRDQIRLLVRHELRRRGLLGDGKAGLPPHDNGEDVQAPLGLESEGRE
jgi:hypothetical protein